MHFWKEYYFRHLYPEYMGLSYMQIVETLIKEFLSTLKIIKTPNAFRKIQHGTPSQDKTIRIDSPAQEVNLTTHIPEGFVIDICKESVL